MESTQTSSRDERIVNVDAGEVTLEGALTIPDGARGLVMFAHGSGSSRHSPRNNYVARQLQEGRLATLLIDLLTADEEHVDIQTRHLRFDIPMLAERLAQATKWLEQEPSTRDFEVGLFGSSTGGGAALVAASRAPGRIKAVVSRGGRPDLAGPALAEVTAPTLLLVGELDTPVIRMNRDAQSRMTSAQQVELKIVPGASHLFEEPGKLEEVSGLAREWFVNHLG